MTPIPSPPASLSSPAPRAASAMRPRARWPRPARISSRWRARKAGWKSSTTRSARTAAAPRWCRSASPISTASRGSARRCTNATASSTSSSAMPACRPVLAARPYRAEAVERRDGGQRHREFPVDPLHGAAAASSPTPAARCSSPRAPRNKAHRLSRPLRRLQGRAGNAGARLGAGDREHADPRQSVQPRPDPHPHARHACFPAKTR